ESESRGEVSLAWQHPPPLSQENRTGEIPAERSQRPLASMNSKKTQLNTHLPGYNIKITLCT
ncbi:MAG: hypothetical protein ACK56F_32255, partial [bacterium]